MDQNLVFNEKNKKLSRSYIQTAYLNKTDLTNYWCQQLVDEFII